MAISVTITAPNVTDSFGRALVVGATYSLGDDLAKSLIGQGKATAASAYPGNPPLALNPAKQYAGTPISNVTPDTVGQYCQDTTTGVWYVATTAASTGWRPASAGVAKSYAGSPVGNLTPDFVGQWCYDSTNGLWYLAYGVTSTSWRLNLQAAYNSSNQLTGIAQASGAAPLDLVASYGYHFHGWAPNQASSADVKFWDISGQNNDAVFQTHLTAANAWANAGFLTQADPSGAGNLLLTAIPATSWSYSAGDSLFIFWKGMATPEGSDMPIMGNTTGSSANGFRITVTSAGKAKFNCYQASGALSNFGGTSGNTVFEAATSHSFAVAVDGVTGKHCYWGDGSRDSSYGSGFLTLGSNGIIDTLSATSIKLGGDGGTSGSVQQGVACRTQSLIILCGRRGLGTPSVADLDLLIANMHRSPQSLITASYW